jgi:LysM repeat protein
MKKISLLSFILALAASPLCAQDAATQQQIDDINGTLQSIQDTQRQQNQRLTALEKQINDLQDKLSQPAANNSASADDLKKLADQVQEIDKKRQDDNEHVLKALENLEKSMGATPSGHKQPPVTQIDTPNTAGGSSGGGAQQKGYYYEVKSGDTLSAISKAYRAQGIKVSVDQILAANPGLTAKNLEVGKKVFIPQP